MTYKLLVFSNEVTNDQRAKEILIKEGKITAARSFRGLRGGNADSLLCNSTPRRRRRRTKRFGSVPNNVEKPIRVEHLQSYQSKGKVFCIVGKCVSAKLNAYGL